MEGLEPWLCHDCGDCSIACPREADPAQSMRTLRRFLTGKYDWTGLSSRILRSRAWHFASLAFVAALVFALLVAYHLHWVELPAREFATTPMGMEHMFPKILYFTWITYGLVGLFVLSHVFRMERLTMGKAGIPLRVYLTEAWISIVHLVTHKGMLRCTAEARAAQAHDEKMPPIEVVPHRWLKHWLMAFGTVAMLVLTAAFLRWFQTDKIYPLYHPQRWLGYLATAFILWATTDILLRRIRHRQVSTARKRGPLTLPLLLWLTAVTGIAIHVFRLIGLELGAHYAYAVHLMICVPLVVVEVPFGDWAHMIDRPLAIYFQAVRQRALQELPVGTGLEPARP